MPDADRPGRDAGDLDHLRDPRLSLGRRHPQRRPVPRVLDGHVVGRVGPLERLGREPQPVTAVRAPLVGAGQARRVGIDPEEVVVLGAPCGDDPRADGGRDDELDRAIREPDAIGPAGELDEVHVHRTMMPRLAAAAYGVASSANLRSRLAYPNSLPASATTMPSSSMRSPDGKVMSASADPSSPKPPAYEPSGLKMRTAGASPPRTGPCVTNTRASRSNATAPG